MNEMATKKIKLEAAVRRTAAILEDHLGSLPPAEAKATLREIHSLALESSPSTGKNSCDTSPSLLH